MRADLGDCKDNGSNNDTRGLWENTHDSCVGMHPGWEVPGMSAFREWCVPADRCTVIDYETGSDGASFKSTPSYDSFKSTPSYNEPEPQKPQIQENHFMVIDGMGIPNVFAGCPMGIPMEMSMGFPMGMGGRVVIARPGFGGFGFFG